MDSDCEEEQKESYFEKNQENFSHLIRLMMQTNL